MIVCAIPNGEKMTWLLERKELCQPGEKCAASASELLRCANGYASGNEKLFDDQQREIV